MRRARWFGCVVAALTSASASQAVATPSAKLVYVRGTGTTSCPDESELRRAVSARIGYDPFFPTASKTVVAQVTRAAKGFRARVQIVGDDGRVRGEKDLTTGGDDCNELIATMALAISIALDDLDDGIKAAPATAAAPAAPQANGVNAVNAANEEAPPRAAVPETPPKDAPAPPARPANAPPSESRRLTMTASAGPAFSIGAAPAPSVGGALAATIRYSWAAARFALRGDLPSSGDLERGGRVTTRTVLATAAACVRGDVPFFCAGAGLGSLDATTQEIARPSSDDALLVLLVATGGVDLALGSQLYVEPFVDAGFVLTRHRVSVDGISGYVLPIFAGTAGLHLGLRLF